MLTIFTPTFNRATKLKRIYDSLLVQTGIDFEWLIVDDGSTDNTKEVVKGFSTNKFPIRYYKKENGGKHTAYNFALEHARGDFFLCVDSDDWLSKDAVKIISQIFSNKQENIVLAYKRDHTGRLLSKKFPSNVSRMGILELEHYYQCVGEFSLIFRTKYAQKYPFPVFNGEKFVTESVVYDRMFISEKAFLLPEVITECEYQSDGLTNNLNAIMKKNPAGYCLYFMQRIDLQDKIIQRIIVAGKYHCFCHLAGKQKSDYIGRYPFLVMTTKFLGSIFLLYYKVLRGF